jgi:hypothetical protein
MRAAGVAAASVAVAGLVLLVALPGGAGAQEGTVPGEVARTAPGMVTAQTFRAPPAGFSVAVAPYDDSELNLKLKADFEAALAQRWQARMAEEPAAAFLLLFESEVVPANLAPAPPSLGSARLSDGGAEVNVNVWSSSQDSVLGGRQEGPEAGANVFHINAVLRDRASGEVVWQGDGYYVLREPETERVARALVPPLVERIGQSVVREPLNFD